MAASLGLARPPQAQGRGTGRESGNGWVAPLDRRKEVEQLDLKVTSKEEKKDEEVTGDPRGWSRVSGVGEVVPENSGEGG